MGVSKSLTYSDLPSSERAPKQYLGVVKKYLSRLFSPCLLLSFAFFASLRELYAFSLVCEPSLSFTPYTLLVTLHCSTVIARRVHQSKKPVK